MNKRVSRQRRTAVAKYLKGEVQAYSDHMSGAVYGYVVEKDGEEIESCWGFIGDYEGYCLAQARKVIKGL